MNRSLSIVLKPAVTLDLQNLNTSGNKQAYDDLISIAVFYKESFSILHTTNRIYFQKPFVNIQSVNLQDDFKCHLGVQFHFLHYLFIYRRYSNKIGLTVRIVFSSLSQLPEI